MLSACLIVVIGYSVFGVAHAVTDIANSDRRALAVFLFFSYLFAYMGTMNILGVLNGF